MHVSVVYALPDEQFIEELDVPEASTIEQVIQMSQVLVKFPELDLAVNKVGVFAKLTKLDAQVAAGERIEIYRAVPRKPRDAHASDDKKERIRAKKERNKTAE
ncbi:MAG TPA: RnfH family protein [Ghiorsea sp.]|nr:RnfH family protein [Ghiorsea sp.]HIP06625.1 RnfH family protein [Mariprofundaceae bacterium]